MGDTLKGEFILNASEDAKEELKSETISNDHLAKDHSSTHFYSSFKMRPDGIHFAEQESNEEILLLLRRHFVTNVPWILASIILALIPPLFPLILQTFPIQLPSADTLMLFTAFYYLAIFGFILINFSLWYFHTGLVTTIRLIDIDLAGILYRQISEAKNRHIEDVTYTQIGFIRSLFNYGDVTVQTAGAESNIEYDRIPRPSLVADIIGDLQK